MPETPAGNIAMIRIGIDPGVSTGVAVSVRGNYEHILTMKIHDALPFVEKIIKEALVRVVVIVEDARKGGGSIARKQGAGSVKRDCKIWEDFLKKFEQDPMLESYFVRPNKKILKIDADKFKKITGWEGRTSNHARDAAMLIFCG